MSDENSNLESTIAEVPRSFIVPMVYHEVYGASENHADDETNDDDDDYDDDDDDDWEDGGGANEEVFAQARWAEAAAPPSDIPPRVHRMVGHLEAPASAPAPAPAPAGPTRKEDLHFLRDLIESVQEARPDIVSEGDLLRASNLLRDFFREEEVVEAARGRLEASGAMARITSAAGGRPVRIVHVRDESHDRAADNADNADENDNAAPADNEELSDYGPRRALQLLRRRWEGGM